MTYSIRVRPDADGYYAHARGQTLATTPTRDEADEIVRAAPNGAEWEVVEHVPGQAELDFGEGA